MAHMVETMAYAGKVPWHGLGEKVEDTLTPEEMLVKAGLDWSVRDEIVQLINQLSKDTQIIQMMVH